jgi:hypothetical protein
VEKSISNVLNGGELKLVWNTTRLYDGGAAENTPAYISHIIFAQTRCCGFICKQASLILAIARITDLT